MRSIFKEFSVLNEEFHFVSLVVNIAINVFKLGILFCVYVLPPDVEDLLKCQFSHYVVKQSYIFD